jgi:hypothetical protein
VLAAVLRGVGLASGSCASTRSCRRWR